MRYIHGLAVIALFGVALVFPACSDKGDTGPAGPAGVSNVPTPYCSNPSSQGLTAVGSSVFHPGAGNLFASGVTLANAETATGISILVGSGAVTGQIRFGIYNDTGANYPGVLVYQSDPQNLVTNTWNSAAITNLYLPAGTYWLAFECSTQPNNIVDNATGGTYYWIANNWAVMPDGFTVGRAAWPLQFNLVLKTCP